MTKELREALKELVFDTVCIGLPKDSVIVGYILVSPARKKLLEENIGTYIDEAEKKFIALFDRYAAEREKKARKNGYNAGWSTRNKTKPKIHRCICDSCRVIQEAALKETTKPAIQEDE